MKKLLLILMLCSVVNGAVGYFDDSYLTVGLFKQPTGTASKNTGTVVPVKGPNSPATVTATLENLAVDYGWRSDLQSYRFGQGINNIVYSNDIGDLSGNKLTVAVWMKCANVASAQNVWAKVLSGTTKIVIHRQHNDTFEIRVCNGSSASIMRFLRPSGHAEPNTLFSMVTVIDVTQAVNTDRIKVYVDGIACSVVGTPGTIPTTLPNVSSTALRVGGWGAADPLTGINGEMYTMLTFNTAKTSDEVSALHALGTDLGGLTLQSDGTLYSAKRVWNSTSSTNMNLAANYSGSGSILTTDTLIFNNTSVVNATATANLSVAHVDIQSTYSGNWTMTGYSLTLNNGGLLRSGSGTFTLGTGLTFNGNGKLYTDATSGTNTQTQCVITFNGNDTTDIDKELNVKGIVVNGHLYNMGNASFTITRNNVTTVIMGASGVLDGVGTISIRSGASHNPFSFQPTSVFNPSGNVFISCFNLSGTTITITLPAISSPLTTFALSCVANGGSGIYEFTGDFIFRSLVMLVGSASVDPMTFNTNNHLLKGSSVGIGSNKAGVKCYANLGSSTIKVNTFNTSQYQLDSTIINCSGATFDVNTEWTHGTHERLDGTYTIATPTDLFMGHSMLANSNLYSPAWFYEDNYGYRAYKNRAVSGSKIDNIFTRVDSCLTAYTPNRFFMWIGLNELNLEDVTKFDSATAWYFTYWTQIISKVKTAGIDSVYIVEMAPVGTGVSPMSATKQANFKRFNSALKDSCRTNGLFFIATYDSLLQPGYTDRINPLYATDGIHPNGTIAGLQYCAYLFSLARLQKFKSRQNSDHVFYNNNYGVARGRVYYNAIDVSSSVTQWTNDSIKIRTPSLPRGYYTYKIYNSAGTLVDSTYHGIRIIVPQITGGE